MASAVATQHVVCNICASGETDPVTVQNSCRIVQCRGCGFVYVNPRPDASAFEELYIDYLPDKMEAPVSWQRYMRNVFRNAADVIERQLPGKGSSLDIGCGFGYFVKEMKERGWEAAGIDISSTAVSQALSLGLDVAQGTIETRGYEDNTFDAVTMFYVLEHLPDPLSTLKRVRSILKPDGVLLLRLPHTTPIVKLLRLLRIKNNLYDPPFHLSDFSPGTTRRVLEQAGFDGIKTFVGGATLPGKVLPRLLSTTSTALAEVVYRLSAGGYLLPGVSNTTVANKS